MRQGLGLVLVLVLFLIGAGVFVVTAVSLRSGATASAATLSVQPSQSAGADISMPSERTQPMDVSTTRSLGDDESEGIPALRASHQGYCDGDKETSSAGY